MGLTLLQGFWGEHWGIVNTETCDSAMREGVTFLLLRLSLGRERGRKVSPETH